MSITFLRRKEKGASVQYSKSDLPVIMFYSRILYKFAYLLQTGKIFFYQICSSLAKTTIKISTAIHLAKCIKITCQVKKKSMMCIIFFSQQLHCSVYAVVYVHNVNHLKTVQKQKQTNHGDKVCSVNFCLCLYFLSVAFEKSLQLPTKLCCFISFQCSKNARHIKTEKLPICHIGTVPSIIT